MDEHVDSSCVLHDIPEGVDWHHKRFAAADATKVGAGGLHVMPSRHPRAGRHRGGGTRRADGGQLHPLRRRRCRRQSRHRLHRHGHRTFCIAWVGRHGYFLSDGGGRSPAHLCGSRMRVSPATVLARVLRGKIGGYDAPDWARAGHRGAERLNTFAKFAGRDSDEMHFHEQVLFQICYDFPVSMDQLAFISAGVMMQ